MPRTLKGFMDRHAVAIGVAAMRGDPIAIEARDTFAAHERDPDDQEALVYAESAFASWLGQGLIGEGA